MPRFGATLTIVSVVALKCVHAFFRKKGADVDEPQSEVFNAPAPPPPRRANATQKSSPKSGEQENSVSKMTATQKFKLYKEDGVWKTQCALRGLALGGWFIPEKFINIHGFNTPDMPKEVALRVDPDGSIYEGTDETVRDMCSLSKTIGRDELDSRFRHHLEHFITELDFEFISKTGVNMVRIPIGYWNVMDDPYQIYAPIDPKFSLNIMDQAMDWAEKYELAVLLDVHASPGSQNGWEHSGCMGGGSGLFKGKNADLNRKLSVKVAANLAQRYGNRRSLLGIQVINEPKGFEVKDLVQLYQDSYDAIRKYSKDAWVVAYAHNFDRAKHLEGKQYHNLVLDKHEYACFGDGRRVPLGQSFKHHTVIAESWGAEVQKMNSLFPTIVGEWSLCHGGGTQLRLGDWNAIQQNIWNKSTVGAIFWTYKTMTDNARWSFRTALDTVDVMGNLPRCRSEYGGSKQWLPHAVRNLHVAGGADDIDVGYEWESELEKFQSVV